MHSPMDWDCDVEPKEFTFWANLTIDDTDHHLIAVTFWDTQVDQALIAIYRWHELGLLEEEQAELMCVNLVNMISVV